MFNGTWWAGVSVYWLKLDAWLSSVIKLNLSDPYLERINELYNGLTDHLKVIAVIVNAGSIEVKFYTCGTVDGYMEGAVHYPPGFFKVITPKAFDLVRLMTIDRLVNLERMAIHLKRQLPQVRGATRGGAAGRAPSPSTWEGGGRAPPADWKEKIRMAKISITGIRKPIE